MGLFAKDFEKLNSKIANLRNELESLRYSLFDWQTKRSWENIFDLTKAIQHEFKTVRYPTKQERDAAWQQFFELRQDVYDAKNEHFKSMSREHKDDLYDRLRDLEYWKLREGIREMLLDNLNQIRVEVIENGRKLNEVGQYFSSVKHEITADDKVEIFNRIKEIRESHDEFWGEYKDRSRELQEAKEERKKDYEERRERKERAKEKLVENIDNNKEKLEKAENALSRQETHKRDLEDKLDDAYSDGFRERCEGWLDECTDKIADIESYIDRLKEWIEDGERRLRDWD